MRNLRHNIDLWKSKYFWMDVDTSYNKVASTKENKQWYTLMSLTSTWTQALLLCLVQGMNKVTSY